MFSIEFLHVLRTAELERVARFLEPGARILEIGAGTGVQSMMLQRLGHDVVAIDVEASTYAGDRVFPVIDYDGRTIPLADASVDVVFSSNVLEHVQDLTALHTEIRRVLRPGGYCLHVMPTHGWRFWTTLSGYPTAAVVFAGNLPALVPRSLTGGELRRLGTEWYRTLRRMAGLCLQSRHGERGNIVSELWLFHPGWWRRNFRSNGFAVEHDEPVGLFYTGNLLFGPRLSLERRAALARTLGSACHVFKLRPAG